MQVEGTKQAFKLLVNQKGFAGRSGIDKALVSLWSSGKRVPTLDKMEEVLLNHGSSVVSEKVWEVPNQVLVSGVNHINIEIDDLGVTPITRVFELDDHFYKYRCFFVEQHIAHIQIELPNDVVFSFLADQTFFKSHTFYEMVKKHINDNQK